MSSRKPGKPRNRLCISLAAVLVVLGAKAAIGVRTFYAAPKLGPSQRSTIEGVLTIPEQAVLYDKNRAASVWVPDTHGHRIMSIKPRLSNGRKVEIASGPRISDQVILQQTS